MPTMPRLVTRVMTMPILWWALALVFFLHDLIGNLGDQNRPDARSVIQAGDRWLHDPAAIYAETARHLADTGLVPVTGLIRPPAAAMLAAPFSLLPSTWQIPTWTAVDALAALLGLLIVQRLVARTSLETAIFWAVALYAPPLYAEINAGQIGGFVLLPACAGLVTYRRRAWLAGVLAAASASLKFYPALMVLGARRRWRPFLIGAVAAGVVITVIACVPLGPAHSWEYVTGVLLPSLRAPNPDCAQTSVATLFGRSIGGDPYPIINPDDSVSMLQSPLRLPVVATILTWLVLASAVVASVWSARRSGWNPAYGLAMGLALGALLPGELNPYQYLPLLPVTLMVLVVSLQNGNRVRLLVIAAGLLLWWRQPCLLPFPNLWTIGALLLFTACALAARDFHAKATTSPSETR